MKTATNQKIIETEEYLSRPSLFLEEKETPEQKEEYFKGLFEALLFLSNDPLPLSFFVKNSSLDSTQVKIIIDSLIDEYEEKDGGIKLAEISNGFQFITNSKFSDSIREALGKEKKETLTKSMLETLAIIAYKQPISLSEIEELRGVSSRMMVAKLVKRDLIFPAERKEVPGRPLAYKTTDQFLKFFGLNNLTDLPKISEIQELILEDENEF